MAYDLNRCPQNDAECADYFFTLIGREKGRPATNWDAVMTAHYPWKGQMIQIPRGVGPGIKQQPGAPFFGLTQNLDSSGNPQGRSYWPTAEPDGNNFYTRAMQYLDGPQESLVWAYYWFAGKAYAPLEPATPAPGPDPIPVPPSTDLEARIAELERQVRALTLVVVPESRIREIAKEEVKGAFSGLEVLVDNKPANGVTLGKHDHGVTIIIKLHGVVLRTIDM